MQRKYFLELLPFLSLLATVDGLTCYQNKDKSDEVLLMGNEDFVFCVFFPEKRNDKNEVVEKAFSTGITADELEEMIEKFFKDDTPYYEIISVCLYEKYNWPKLWKTHQIRSGKGKPPAEGHTFRCLCNTNLCNSEATFRTFLSGVSMRYRTKDDGDTVLPKFN